MWEAEDRRAAWWRDSLFYRTAGKSFGDIKEPDWKRQEPDWKALFPERYPEYQAELAEPKRNQWELYQELLASGRLREIERTRHLRADQDAAGQHHDPRGIRVSNFDAAREKVKKLYG